MLLNYRISTVWILIIFAVVAHLALYWLPFINLEWTFADATSYFETNNQQYLNHFFSFQANTLGIPLLAFLFNKIIPFFDIALAPRFIAVSGFIFLGVALIRFNNLTGNSIHRGLLISIVFLNPIIWVFGGRGTADFFPATLVLFSLSLFWDKQWHPLKIIFAILLFSIAVVVKYHAIILLPLIWLEAITRFENKLITVLFKMFIITVLILVIPLIYLLYIKHNFEFWLTPPAFQHIHQLKFSFFPMVTNFIIYCGYLTLLALPFSLLPLWNRLRSISGFLFFSILFLFGYFLLETNGEMNFGPLDTCLNKQFVNGILCCCAGLLFLILKDGFDARYGNEDARRMLLCIIGSLVIFIAILSFTRPAQRYLLFILPLVYLFVGHNFDIKEIVTWIAIIIYILMNIYITISQYATGQASLELTNKIIKENLILTTNPGAIVGHTGNSFPTNTMQNKRYIVIVGQHPKQLFYSTSTPVPFVSRTYSVIPQ